MSEHDNLSKALRLLAFDKTSMMSSRSDDDSINSSDESSVESDESTTLSKNETTYGGSTDASDDGDNSRSAGIYQTSDNCTQPPLAVDNFKSHSGNPTTRDKSTESPRPAENSPRLPVEIMIKIFKFARQRDISLAPVLRASQLNYQIAMPLLYSTLRLNRNTLPRLVKYMSIEPSDRKKELLGRFTTLEINDITIMFGFKWEEDLKIFCDVVVLPSVTTVVWIEDEIRECDETGPKLKYREMLGRNGKPVYHPIPHNPSTIDYKFQVTLPKQFASVLPNEQKDVLIILPPSGRFQQIGPVGIYHVVTRPWRQLGLTTDRIMRYISAMSGDVTLTIHQPINSDFLTLSDTPGTFYSFYEHDNISDSEAKLQLISAFEKTVSRRLSFLVDDCRQWKDYLTPVFKGIVMSGMEPEGMMKACIAAIRNSPEEWSTRYKEVNIDLEGAFLDMVHELIVLLHSEKLMGV